jgi:phosphate transport system permease protein
MGGFGRKLGELRGEALTALCAGALALNLLLVVGLLGVLAANGMSAFWQRGLVALELRDGTRLLGELHRRETIPVEGQTERREGAPARIQIEVGNRDLTGSDFRWVDEEAIARRSWPADAALLERLEWGNFYGTLVELRRGGEVLAARPGDVWGTFQRRHEVKRAELEALERFERREIGEINHRIEQLRLAQRRHPDRARLADEQALAQRRYEELAQRLFAMREALSAETLVMEAADGTRKEMAVSQVVRALRPNRMGTYARMRLYASRVAEFLADNPRESNTEGGIFPAIFGTVMMVFIMSFAVTPLGVLAALYMREYARQGPLVRVVRIAVNNLAGVPSIVFGVFGLGFFVYLVGGSIDRLFYPEALPSPTYGTGGILWASLTLALLTVPVVIVATEEGLAAVPRVMREGSRALGATKFETTWRVVLPAAAPGILTGLILAMARAAGEVAPLMIVGMVKLAPSLPVDHHFPFVNLERKFMHLGFHIYDVGFQGPNVEASKPLDIATALLLILVVTVMNLTAIGLRNHLRRKYSQSAV